MSHILIIEDDPTIVSDACRALRRRGHEVTVAFDGSEGYLSAIGERPDLVLLDLALPGFSGRQVLALLARSRDTARIPVLLLQSDGAAGRLPPTDLGNRVGSIEVPFAPRDLVDAVEQALDRRAVPAA